MKQPCAWAIRYGFKTVENRSKPTSYRGELAIHAGVAWHERWGAHPAMRQAWHDWSTAIPLRKAPGVEETGFAGDLHDGPHLWLPRGSVVAVVDLVGCHEATGGCCDPWGEITGYHWDLADVRRTSLNSDDLACRGQLGIWTLPDDVAASVRTQIQ